MKLTKFEHACLLIEITDHRLIIDPGSFTMPLGDFGDVVAIVITHEHGDHATAEQLERIVARNPEVKIFGPKGAVKALKDFDITESHDGDKVTVEPFELEFVGSKHAIIHSTVPQIDNVGVLVNDLLFYPGDAFTKPKGEIDTLAVPSSAPWLKIAEVMDYVLDIKPKRAFPVHEMLLSVAGKAMSNQRIKDVTEISGGEFFVLEPGESLDL
jgi:L-ascorbate metabolism protein UlaG (beta-lactamase superfamily)